MNLEKHSWNNHSYLEGMHAFLGASNYHWLNYDDEKIKTSYKRNQAKERGTRLHAFAAEAIELRRKMPNTPDTLNMYVNDGIGFRMKTEVVLFYSKWCFGTADTISFRDNVLRVSDLKTGIAKCSMLQLRIYAALFCLEYKVTPGSIKFELRMYKDDDVELEETEPEEIIHIMDNIKRADRILNELYEEEG